MDVFGGCHNNECQDQLARPAPHVKTDKDPSISDPYEILNQRRMAANLFTSTTLPYSFSTFTVATGREGLCHC